jgi:hypothetical protein
MDYVSVIKLLLGAGPGLFAYFKRQKAIQAAEDYLRAKYSLGMPKSIHEGSTANFPIICTYVGCEWTGAITSVLTAIKRSTTTDESLCRTCGELAMFIRVLGSHCIRGEYVGDVGKYGDPRYEQLIGLAGSETDTSLLEMGRGRGGEYALQLIKTELGERLRAWDCG